MEEEREFQWKSVIWSAILIFVIPFIVQLLIPTVYATYTGFQTRGDQDAINQAVQTITRTSWLPIVICAAYALTALWRGAALAKKVEYRPDLHALAAGGLASIPVIILSLGDLVFALILVVLIVGGAYLGALLGKPRNKAEG